MPRRCPITVLCLVTFGMSVYGASEPPSPWGTVRGVTISTHTDGRDWAYDKMIPTMREIRDLGANWITIHPYAGIRADGGFFQIFLVPRSAGHRRRQSTILFL